MSASIESHHGLKRKKDKNATDEFCNLYPTVVLGSPSCQRSKDLALVYAEHPPPGLFLLLVDSYPHCVLKHLLHAAVAEGRALHVAFGFDFASHLCPFGCCDAVPPIGPRFPQICLGGHNQHRDLGQVLPDLRDPLVVDIGQRIGVRHGVTDENDVGLLVGPGSDLPEVVVACCVPQSQADVNAIHVHLHSCIIEHCGPVGLWEGLWGEADQQRRLSHSAVPNKDALHGHSCQPVHGHLVQRCPAQRLRLDRLDPAILENLQGRVYSVSPIFPYADGRFTRWLVARMCANSIFWDFSWTCICRGFFPVSQSKNGESTDLQSCYALRITPSLATRPPLLTFRSLQSCRPVMFAI